MPHGERPATPFAVDAIEPCDEIGIDLRAGVLQLQGDGACELEILRGHEPEPPPLRLDLLEPGQDRDSSRHGQPRRLGAPRHLGREGPRIRGARRAEVQPDGLGIRRRKIIGACPIAGTVAPVPHRRLLGVAVVDALDRMIEERQRLELPGEDRQLVFGRPDDQPFAVRAGALEELVGAELVEGNEPAVLHHHEGYVDPIEHCGRSFADRRRDRFRGVGHQRDVPGQDFRNHATVLEGLHDAIDAGLQHARLSKWLKAARTTGGALRRMARAVKFAPSHSERKSALNTPP